MSTSARVSARITRSRKRVFEWPRSRNRRESIRATNGSPNGASHQTKEIMIMKNVVLGLCLGAFLAAPALAVAATPSAPVAKQDSKGKKPAKGKKDAKGKKKEGEEKKDGE
jgi:hypothetical protein